VAAKAIAEIIQQFRKELVSLGLDPERVVLFGSRQSGDSSPSSDIDLVVISDGFKDKDIRERLELLGVAAARILEPIDALGVTPQEWDEGDGTFAKEVARSGTVFN
jgi:predicted nucleotidyltransferase